jgi:hypothetical protein
VDKISLYVCIRFSRKKIELVLSNTPIVYTPSSYGAKIIFFVCERDGSSSAMQNLLQREGCFCNIVELCSKVLSS